MFKIESFEGEVNLERVKKESFFSRSRGLNITSLNDTVSSPRIMAVTHEDGDFSRSEKGINQDSNITGWTIGSSFAVFALLFIARAPVALVPELAFYGAMGVALGIGYLINAFLRWRNRVNK